MKMIFAVIAVIVMAAAAVLAQPAPSCTDLGYDYEKIGGVGSPDDECIEAGFDFGVAKYDASDGWIKTGDFHSYATTLSGDTNGVDWISNPAIDAILSKEGNCYKIHNGGTSGSFNKIHYEISHVTFCGNDEPNNDIPEFGVVAAIGALAGAGYIISRKRK